MAGLISIQGLNRADVLCALYNAAKPQGMGFVQYDPTPMTREQAEEILKQGHTYFDYLKGRVMKLDLSGDFIAADMYDRDNGPGAAALAISQVVVGLGTDSEAIQALHKANTVEAAKRAREATGQPNKTEDHGRFSVFTLGLAGQAEHLTPILDEILGCDSGDDG